MIAYIMINQAILALTGGAYTNQLGASIRDGSVTVSLLQPMSYRLYLFSSMMGNNWYVFLFSALPVIIAGSFITGFPAPPSPAGFLFFVPMSLVGILIMFEITYIFGLFAFWTQTTWFIPWYVEAGKRLFGGTVIPLWFYPGALERVTRYLPFRYIAFEGINCYLGRLSVYAMARSLITALIWWIVLYGAGRLIWFRARKKLVLNGG
jgi:ABC-2 type transport system permease protein